ncbi:MAG: hypothetical protein U0X20_17690 [Caldilineaceae bacterium]
MRARGTVAAVVDRSPICTAAAPSVARLWPVDNRLVAVGVTGITDPDDPPVRARSTFGGPVADPPTVTITAISQDEPVDDPIDPTAGQAGEPVGDYYGPDGSGLEQCTAWLRPERSPRQRKCASTRSRMWPAMSPGRAAAGACSWVCPGRMRATPRRSTTGAATTPLPPACAAVLSRCAVGAVRSGLAL